MTIPLHAGGRDPGDRAAAEAQAAETGAGVRIRQAPPPGLRPGSTPQPAVPAFDGQVDALQLRDPAVGSPQLLDEADSAVLNVLDNSPHPGLRDLAQRIRDL